MAKTQQLRIILNFFLERAIRYKREAEIDTKIVGGKQAYPHSIPWQVALVLTNTSNLQCGGTIICDKYVLTAGKCSCFKTWQSKDNKKFLALIH